MIREFQVPLQALPTSAAAPATSQGPTLAQDILLDSLFISNPGSSTYTVTITDNQGTPVTLLKSYSLAAGASALFAFGGIRLLGGLKWVATNVAVVGAITGRM